MNRLSALVVALLGLFSIVGCDSDGDALCVPGESKACTGTGACSGYQVCADSADRFLDCQCGLADVIEEVIADDVAEDVGTDIRIPDNGQNANADDDIPVEDVCGEEQERPCTGNVCHWGMSLACPEGEPDSTPTEAEMKELLSCSKSSEVCARCGVNGQWPCGNVADGGVYCRSNAVQWYSPDIGVSLSNRAALLSCVACGSKDQLCCVYKGSFYKDIYDQDLLPKAMCQDGLTCDQSSGIPNMRCITAPAS